jgi:hypothetical protein
MTAEQLFTALNLLYKTAFSYLAITFYNSLNSFTDILVTMKILKLPPIVIMLFTISYRLFYIYIKKARWMLKSYRLKVYRNNRFPILLQMIKTMLLKSFLYTNKIASAMRSRNFSAKLDFRKIK